MLATIQVQNILSFTFVSQNIKIKIHGTTILLFVLQGYETLFLTREEHGLRLLGPRVLEFDLRGTLQQNSEERFLTEKLHNLYSLPNIVAVIKQRMTELGIWHVWGTREVHTGFWWGDMRGRDHLEDLDIDGKTVLKCILKNRLE